jgi:tetrapyrrole methylase family protein/MazG family protein
VARVDVIGLGPAGRELLTVQAGRLISEVAWRYLRTRVHPAAEAVPDASSFDHLYETLDRIDEVYPSIVGELIDAARRHGRVLYAVPGSPSVGERTVELLLEAASDDRSLEVVVHPAMSFLEPAWTCLGVDPLAHAVTLVDAHRFEATRPPGGGAVLVVQCDSRFALSDVKLAVDPPPDGPVIVLQRLGLPEEQVWELDWADLDRAVEPDHLTSVWIPDLPPSAGGRLERFAALMERLRSEDPWKAAQSHDSLRRYLLEEAYEVLEALDAYDPDTGEGAEELASELGDLLYQVVFHASLARQAGWFDLAEVIGAIHDKLDQRHPHLGSGRTPALDELAAGWEAAKLAEHGRTSAFDGVPVDLPALLREAKLLRKGEALGLEVGDPPVGEPAAALFVAARRLVQHGEDPEDLLRRLLGSIEADLRRSEAARRPGPSGPPASG